MESGDAAEHLDAALRHAVALADRRKFLEYVLVPGHRNGKSHIFLETLGFRPFSVDDAEVLARLYEREAKIRIGQQRYRLGKRDEHGQRCTIVIVVRGVPMRSGWILRRDGTLWLTTPFAGFAPGLDED